MSTPANVAAAAARHKATANAVAKMTPQQRLLFSAGPQGSPNPAHNPPPTSGCSISGGSRRKSKSKSKSKGTRRQKVRRNRSRRSNRRN
jgi:hypothetical protein